MSAPATVPAFLDLCRKSGVVDEARLTVSGPAAESPVAAAKSLIRAGALTKFQAAQLLAGKYKGLRFDRLKILDRIGAGGMGTVFLCDHTGLGKRVAVKVLPPDQAGDEGNRERFFREARAAAALDHPNIVRVYDANTTGGVHYIVMEYVDGRDLQTLLNKYGPIPFEKACTYIAQAALGLQHAADKGIVHRDIKPANLLVDKDGVVKVLDMGLARFQSEGKESLTAKYDQGAILGTADYMAPEQVLASSTVDIRADVYALGVTLYALINGKPPFAGTSTQKMAGHQSVVATPLTKIRREVPKGLSAVVDKMMAKSPAARYQTPADVVSALSPYLDADTIPLASSRTGKVFPTSGVRRPVVKSKGALIAAAVGVAAVVFGGLGVWAVGGGSEPLAGKAVAQNLPVKPDVQRPPAVAPRPWAQGPSVYRLDLTDKPDAVVEARGGMTEADGRLPGRFAVFTWEKASTAEAAVATVDGHRAITLRTTAGRPAAMLFGPYLKLEADREYRIALEYQLTGSAEAQLKIDDSMIRGRDLRPLPPTGAAWATADVTFRAGSTVESGKVEFSYSGSDILAVRRLEVADLGPAPAPARVLYQSDFDACPPAHFRKRGQATVASSGGLPPGLWGHAWAGDTLMECAVEAAGDHKALAVRNLEGRESAMLFLPDVAVRAGKTYWVSVEYQSTADTAGTIRVACEPAKARNVGDLVTTRGEWRTVHAPFQPADGEGEKARVEIHARGAGADKGLLIRSITVAATAPPAALYRFAAADAKPFRAETGGGTILQAPATELPADWLANSWKPGDTGEIGVADVAGRRGLYLQNPAGSVSVQVWTGRDVAELKAGVPYEIKVTYHAEAQARGHLDARRTAHVDSRIGSVALKPTDGRWVETSLKLTPAESGPVVLFLQSFVGGPDTRIAVHGIEVVGPAGPVAARPYRLDLSGTKAFARRYKGEVIVESQGDGDLPAGWTGRTAKEETSGDVFAESVGGATALGLRNQDGPPSVRLSSPGELLRAAAGKRYAIKIIYQTEANGRGWAAVRVGATEVRKLDLPTSAGAWEETEVVIAAPADGGLALTFGGEAVGSEASVYIKGVEVREVP